MSRRLIFLGQIVLLTLVFGLMFPQKVNAEGNDQPRVMVTDYELEDGGISPGKTNQLTITLKNMNTQFTVYSVLITGLSSSSNVYTKYGISNQAYISELKPNEEKRVILTLEAADTLELENIDYTLNISFKDDIRGTSILESIIHIPIKQEHLKIQRVYIPQTVVLETKSRVSITFENIENEDIYNTIMTVKGSTMKDTSMELGTILSGSRKNQEVYIAFNSIGKQDISVEFTYEDTKGKSYTIETQSYQVEVLPKTNDGQEKQIMVAENKTVNPFSTKQKGYMIGLVLCMIGTFIVIRRGKSK